MPNSEGRTRTRHRLRLAVFALGGILFLLILNAAFEGVRTFERLDAVEAERDRWQRPVDMIQALSLKPGDTVVDLGCGSGYFSLKLSAAAGPSGRVYAVDIRRLPLIFLWLRTIGKGRRNVQTVLGRPDDPRVPAAANAVLIANTYHEIADRKTILARIFQTLASGGRLVVVDPLKTEHGTLSESAAEQEIKAGGFDIAGSNDRFIDVPDWGPWWLIVARKP